MDPSARTFVMQGQDTSANRFGIPPPTAPVDQQLSPCPALRGHNQLPSLHSQVGGWGNHYDPVHHIHHWWPGPSHHDAWQQQQQQQQPPHHNHHPNYVPHGAHHHFTHSPSFTAAPGLGPSSGSSQMHEHSVPHFAPGYGDYFNGRSHPHQHTHSHPHTHMNTRSQAHFTARPTPIPGLDGRMDVFGSYPGTSDHGWGANRLPLPALAQIAPNLPGYMTPRDLMSSRESGGQRESPSSTRVDPSSERPPTAPERQTWPDVSVTTNQSASMNQTTNTVSMPPMPQSTGRLAFGVHTTPIPRFEPTGSLGDSQSDDDSSTDTAMVPADLLDDITALSGARSARLRTAQSMRTARPPQCGRRIASKKAISSLVSVVAEDLPEGERSCIICYNDYGVETPEGIIESPLRLPKCQHVFGDHCIKKWLAESDSCPYCRDKLPSETPALNRQEAVFHLMRQQVGRHGESDASGMRGLVAHAYLHQERRSPPVESGESRRRPRVRSRASALSGRFNGTASTVVPGWGHTHDPEPARFSSPSHSQRHSTASLGSSMVAARLSDGRNNQENNNPRFPGVHSFQSNDSGARLPYPNPLGPTEVDAPNGPAWASSRSGFLPYAVQTRPDTFAHQIGDNLPR